VGSLGVPRPDRKDDARLGAGIRRSDARTPEGPVRSPPDSLMVRPRAASARFPSGGDPMKRSTTTLALVALCAAVFVQAFGSLRRKSLTFDELSYIPAGYSYVRTGDFRLNPEQPPLLKLLAGVAMLPLHPRLPLEDESWRSAGAGVGNTQWNFGRAFLIRDNPDGERLVLFARVPVVLLAMLLVAGVFLLASDLYGPGAGLLAAALCAFDPGILAHARLATSDLGLTCFVLWAVWAYRRLIRAPGPGRALLAGLLLGCALLSKFSGLFLLALYPLWAVVLPLLPDGVPVPDGALRSWQDRPRARRLAWCVALTAAVVAVALMVVSLGYFAPGRVDRYFRDFATVYVNAQPTFRTYFHGHFYDHRLWYYFLAAFLLKTPLALLLLLALRAATQALHREEGWPDRVLLFAPVVVWFVGISWKALQIGVRYVLPVYPFLFVYAAGIVASPVFARRGVRLAVGVLCFWLAASSLAAYPDYLPYFNEIAGGSSHGIEWLDDSNVDWGQDLIQLRTFLAARRITDAKITGMALYEPGMYRIPGEVLSPGAAVRALGSASPPPGIYAVSVHVLNRAKLVADLAVDPLKDRVPLAVLGHTIYVFDLSR
jgi:Dolichyl-phosphate-mannose-protein mannosyltransferase